MSEKKNQSVFTKGSVHALLGEILDAVNPMKSPKEIREYLAGRVTQFKPSGRGRGKKINLDITTLQGIVDELAKENKYNGNPMTLAMLTASRWNTREKVDHVIDGNRVKKLVIDNKINFPHGMGFVINSRPRKQTIKEDNVNETKSTDHITENE